MRANKPSTSQPPGAMVTPAENGFRPRIDASAGDDADRVRILIVDDDPSLRIMFITGFAAVALSAQDRAPAGAKVLSKPVHLRDLVAEVEKMMAA